MASIRTTGSQGPWNTCNDTLTFLVLKMWQQTSVDLYEAWYGSTRFANRLWAWRIDNRGNDSCRFDRIESNRQHFQPTLHSPLAVKILEIMIHEPSSFLKHGHKLQLIRMTCVDSIESSRIDNIFYPPYIVQGRYCYCQIFYGFCISFLVVKVSLW